MDMKLHDMQSKIAIVTGLWSYVEDHDKGTFLAVTVLGDQPHLVEPTAAKLQVAGIPFRKKPKGRKFAGCTYLIPIKNIGTAFHTNWIFDEAH
jgi:hypothetical protein